MQGQNNIPELDRLFQDVRSYRSSKNYMELLDFIKRFRNIAPYNAMLIRIQKPGSKYYCGHSVRYRLCTSLKTQREEIFRRIC